MSVLVIAEHDNQSIKPATLNTIAAASEIGGDIVVAWPDGKGGISRMEPFLTGFVENNQYLGRPVDVMQMKDGSLLISDDHAGAIYRVSYSGQ